MKTFLISFVIFTFFFLQILPAQSSRIFWVDQGAKKIQSAYLDGSDVRDILTGLDMPEGIAIDTLSEPKQIYYSDYSKIVRVNFDGTNPEDVVTDHNGIGDIDLDLVNRRVYWVKDLYDDDGIYRADMDGLNSNVQAVYTSSYAMHSFRGIAVDPENLRVFWTQTVYSGYDRLNRINYDGSGRENIGNFKGPWDIDYVGEKIYWSWKGETCVMKANPDGSAVDTVCLGINTLYIEADTTLKKIFWTESGSIKSANLDGSEIQQVVSGLFDAQGLAIYYDPTVTAIEDDSKTITTFKLKQNYPNPFNPKTTIRYTLPVTCHSELSVYNLLGKKLVTLISKKQPAGNYKVDWHASQFSSGVYFYRLETDKDFVQTRKLILVK